MVGRCRTSSTWSPARIRARPSRLALDAQGRPLQAGRLAPRRCTRRSSAWCSARGTVPGMKLEGEKLAGSRAIMRRLDGLVAEPALLPADAERRARGRARRGVGRRGAPAARPPAELGGRSSASHARRSPTQSRARSCPSRRGWRAPIAAADRRRPRARLNDVSDTSMQEDLHALPGHLDRIDALDRRRRPGRGAAQRRRPADRADAGPDATIGDLAPLIDGRPCARAGPRYPSTGRRLAGSTPAGVLPAPVAARRSRGSARPARRAGPRQRTSARPRRLDAGVGEDVGQPLGERVWKNRSSGAQASSTGRSKSSSSPRRRACSALVDAAREALGRRGGRRRLLERGLDPAAQHARRGSGRS